MFAVAVDGPMPELDVTPVPISRSLCIGLSTFAVAVDEVMPELEVAPVPMSRSLCIGLSTFAVAVDGAVLVSVWYITSSSLESPAPLSSVRNLLNELRTKERTYKIFLRALMLQARLCCVENWIAVEVYAEGEHYLKHSILTSTLPS